MSERCIECGRVVDPQDCSVSWDDGEPEYTCHDCCEDALIDNYWAEEIEKEGTSNDQ